jgi:hypothetical protein
MRTIKTYSKRAPFYNAFMRIHANEKPIGSNVPDGPLPCGIWCRALGFTAQDFDLIFGRKMTRPIPDIDEQLPNDFGRSFYVNVVERIDGGMPRVVWGEARSRRCTFPISPS